MCAANQIQLQPQQPSYSVVFMAIGGAAASVGAYTLVWSKGLAPISKMFLSLCYDSESTVDQTRMDPSLSGTVYQIGRWDIMTAFIYTLLLVIWIHAACYCLQKVLESTNSNIGDAATLARLTVNVIFYTFTILAIVFSIFKGPFSKALVWSGFAGYLPYTGKLIMLFQIAYALQGLVYNVSLRADNSRLVPLYKELIYMFCISTVAYVSLLVPFGYVLLLSKAFVDLLINFSSIINNFDWTSPLVRLFYDMHKYGTLVLSVIFFILGILLCCWAEHSSTKCKVIIMALLLLSLGIEIMTFVFLWNAPPAVIDGGLGGPGGPGGPGGQGRKNNAKNKKATKANKPATRSTTRR